MAPLPLAAGFLFARAAPQIRILRRSFEKQSSLGSRTAQYNFLVGLRAEPGVPAI
jgi:hypothetical protein